MRCLNIQNQDLSPEMRLIQWNNFKSKTKMNIKSFYHTLKNDLLADKVTDFLNLLVTKNSLINYLS